MARASGTYGGEQMHIGSEWGNLEEKDHLENQRVDGIMMMRIIIIITIIMNIKGIGWEYENWIQLAPDMEKCWAPVNTVMSLWVAQRVWNLTG